jgi:hypothetical protein
LLQRRLRLTEDAMPNESWITRAMDRIFFRKLDAQAQARARQEWHAIYGTTRSDPEFFRFQIGVYDAIDNKTSALLTHITLLTAVVAIFFATSKSFVIRFLLMLEVFLYLYATLKCLRCIRLTTPQPGDEDSEWQAECYIELFKRRALYRSASDLTVISTLLLAVLIFFEAVLGR